MYNCESESQFADEGDYDRSVCIHAYTVCLRVSSSFVSEVASLFNVLK